MEKDLEEIRRAIRDIPNFPKPGIIFKDITPLLSNGPLFTRTVDLLAGRYRNQTVDVVLGIESRGFIVGAALAYSLGAGFAIVRKPGKLPYETHRATYELEYGSDSLEVHRDAYRMKTRSAANPRISVRDATSPAQSRWLRLRIQERSDQGWIASTPLLCCSMSTTLREQ